MTLFDIICKTINVYYLNHSSFCNFPIGARIHASSSSAQSRCTRMWWPNNVELIIDNHGNT